jgi:hypothetical protein
MKGTKMSQTKKEKFSSWVKDHSFEITAVTVYATLIVGVTYLAIKQQDAIAKELQKQENWERGQIEDGNIIIEQDDRLLAVKVVSVY